jgi:hypothetical protein
MGERGCGHWEEEHYHPIEDQQRDLVLIFYPNPDLKVAKSPTVKGALGSMLIHHYGATNLGPAPATYLRNSGITSHKPLSPHSKFHVWHRIRLFHSPPPFKLSEGPKIDVIRASPLQLDQFGQVERPARFDTALALHIHKTCVFIVKFL